MIKTIAPLLLCNWLLFYSINGYQFCSPCWIYGPLAYFQMTLVLVLNNQVFTFRTLKRIFEALINFLLRKGRFKCLNPFWCPWWIQIIRVEVIYLQIIFVSAPGCAKVCSYIMPASKSMRFYSKPPKSFDTESS